MDIIRAALYIRVSTDEQVREGYSLEAQKAHLLEYAKKNGYSVVGLYADEGITARKSYKKRKEFMRLISDVEAGKIDLILFIKLDRWFRSVADYYKIQEILDAYGVGWRATTEQYDTTTASGRLYINIRLAVAQDEADRTSERIKFVFDRKVAESQIISGRVPLGYKKDGNKLVIDEEGAEVVRRAYDLYLSLRSRRATIYQMRDEYGTDITYRMIEVMLSNEKYIGKYRDNLNYCPAIIEKSVFDEAQVIRKAGALRSQSSRDDYFYIFSGLVCCPICGFKLGGCSGRNKDHSVFYRYYRCVRFFNDKTCSNNHYISERKIEKYLLENISEEVAKYKVEYELSIKKRKKPPISKRTIENKLAKLRELYINDLIAMADYKKEYDALNVELKKIETVPEDDEKDFGKLEALLSSGFENMYHTLDNKAKRALWHTIIEKIVKRDDGGFDIFFK